MLVLALLDEGGGGNYMSLGGDLIAEHWDSNLDMVCRKDVKKTCTSACGGRTALYEKSVAIYLLCMCV